MRVIHLTPFVLLSTVFVMDCEPPSLYAQDSTPLTVSTETVLPTYSDALAWWMLPASNPWAPYCKQTLLAALEETPQVAMMPDLHAMPSVRAATVAGENVAAAGLPEDTLWVVDLAGAASVAFGVALSQQASVPVALVPTFNNWPAQNEFVPAEETLSALVQLRPRPPDPLQPASRPVFLLDSWRLAYPDEQPDDAVTDNRYALTPADLPSAEVLQAQGIHRIAYVVDDRAEQPNEEDDLNPIFLAYQQAGIVVDFIDLGELLGVPRANLVTFLGTHICHVIPRITVLNDPNFYRRAHGGFGGYLARPSSFHYVTNYTSGHGGG